MERDGIEVWFAMSEDTLGPPEKVLSIEKAKSGGGPPLRRRH